MIKLTDILKAVQYDSLVAELTPYREIETFSDYPGIYLVGFTGDEFPIGPIGEDDIIYIGKTEDSQKTRDANTHFNSERTGSSTLRRSIGALLKIELDLTAIPRNGKSGRRAITHYEFEGAGEDRLTEWMMDNLSLSFWEHDRTRGTMKEIEKAMVKYRSPILNWQNNPNKNQELKELKKACREEARQAI